MDFCIAKLTSELSGNCASCATATTHAAGGVHLLAVVANTLTPLCSLCQRDVAGDSWVRATRRAETLSHSGSGLNSGAGSGTASGCACGGTAGARPIPPTSTGSRWARPWTSPRPTP